MKSHPYDLGTGAAAAHRRELEPELSGGTRAVPGSEVFRDLRRRNERRARVARVRKGARGDRLPAERANQA